MPRFRADPEEDGTNSRTFILVHFGQRLVLIGGTERGVTEPQPNFSACFGAPFMPLPPAEYARLLGQKLDRHGSQAKKLVEMFARNFEQFKGAVGETVRAAGPQR